MLMLAAGTVDIEYHLVEKKGASQMELQGGYGGGGFIGTLGLSFNNFSARNMFKKRPINHYLWEMVKSISSFASQYFFQTYSVSFSEPWFGGKNQFLSVHHYLTVSNFTKLLKWKR